MTPLSDDQRRHLYTSMLRGLANTAQARNCAAGGPHAWSDWHRTVLQHDEPLLGPISADLVMKQTYRIKSERRCECCGKEEVQ